jgi:hypothetical protein
VLTDQIVNTKFREGTFGVDVMESAILRSVMVSEFTNAILTVVFGSF